MNRETIMSSASGRMAKGKEGMMSVMEMGRGGDDFDPLFGGDGSVG